MVFHLIGLGLATEEDITLKGLRAVQRCTKVYLEAYTSILGVPRTRLEEVFGVAIEEAPRELVESQIEPILERAKHEDVALLVVGDPFGATTHCDLLVRAKQLEVPINVVHNASIMNAVGCCGLQLYRFGETISIPFFTSTWRPDSFYDKLAANLRLGLHTLALLDIKVREPTMTSLARGRPEYLPPRFMSIRQGITQLLEIEKRRGEGVCPPEARAVGMARVGAEGQMVVTGSLVELRDVSFGAPLHSLVLIGRAGADEEELLTAFAMGAAQAPRLDANGAAAEDAATARANAAHAGERIHGDDDDDTDGAASEEGADSEAPSAEDGGGEDAKAALAEAGAKAAQGASKATDKEKLDAHNVARAQTLEGEGKKVAGGMHKFDASEVDVHGGDGTADDFLDAFGLG
uniref:diphthine methyl ester synthase n=1 Tax=Haptolina brevifila TaxID=156173 RepID=A0A7S2DK48_9EUKA|mmetsp:Transcript_399/g.775  ORF Transcript_399/g.775 Transcript_399/m.775 type:complete len:406 (+) Transcript_399:123-1340(+)